MVDLSEVAARLDAEEKLKLRYKFPKRSRDGKEVTWCERCGKLLDVEEEANLLYVSQENAVVWIKKDEALEVLPDDGIYV